MLCRPNTTQPACERLLRVECKCRDGQVQAVAFLRRRNGYFDVRNTDRGVHRPDLVLEFAVRHQGMGARRSTAPRAHAPDAKGAGLRVVFWPIETLYRISLRIETLDVPAQDIITRDNVSAKVNAVAYFRVVDANLALSQVQNYLYATSQKAQTTLRSIVGQFELDEILAERERSTASCKSFLTRIPNLGY